MRGSFARELPTIGACVAVTVMAGTRQVKEAAGLHEMHSIGGYDCELVDSPPEKVQTTCSICLLILREPHLISCCGHNFCQSCIVCVETGCPLCKAAEFSVMHNKGLERTLKDLEVQCTHTKAGCKWTGQLRSLEQHLNPNLSECESSCGYVEVKCTHGCGKLIQRRSLGKHGDECPKRPYSCDYCHDFEATFEEVAFKHWSECKCYPVSCPNNCLPYAFERKDLEHHLSNDCPLALVKCDFHYAGCDVQLPRKDMLAHFKENFVHLTLLATLNQKLMQENQKLTEQLLEKDKVLKEITESMRKEHRLREKALDESMRKEIAQLRGEIAVQSSQSKTSIESLKSAIAKKQDKDTAISQEEYTVLMEEVDEHHRSLEQVEATIEKLLPHLGVVPITVTMTQFRKHRRQRKDWYSNPFYTHPRGYNMCLKVVAYGSNDGRGTHISVFFCLMHGDFDDRLRWPFRGKITLLLLNQAQEQEKHFEAVDEFADDAPGNVANRVMGEERAEGWGWSRFISFAELDYREAENCQYLKNDCLRFCVTNVELRD